MPKADKKQRHKAKREAKRKEARRQQSISPIKRLADAPGEIEYWMSDELEEFGQVQMFVFKRAAGLSGIACFLVDRGVVGLKDAWTRMNVEKPEFNEMLDQCRERGITMRHATQGEIRRMVAGGIRWAHENGMRLPKDWVKPASLLGGINDWMTADVSGFIKEFAGHPDDLRQRLIGESFESYIERDDIDFDFSEDAPYMDQKTGEYLNNGEDDLDNLSDEELEEIAGDIPDDVLNEMAERITPVAMELASETILWLETRNEEPSIGLVEAWQSVVVATMLAGAAMPDAPKQEIADFAQELLETMDRRIDVSRLAAYQLAVEQAMDHFESDPALLRRAMLKNMPADDSEESPTDEDGGQ